MIKKIFIFLLILLTLLGIGSYVLYTEGAFQSKEDIYTNTGATMKCEAGKCGTSMEKADIPAQKYGDN